MKIYSCIIGLYLALTQSSLLFGAELPKPMSDWTLVATGAAESTSLADADHACDLIAQPYLERFHFVVCEPYFEYQQRTIHWTELGGEDHVGGYEVSEDSASSSSRQTGSSSFQSGNSENLDGSYSLKNVFGILKRIYHTSSATSRRSAKSWNNFSNSNSSHFTKVPVVIHASVVLNMSKDVTDVLYGWRLLVSEPKELNPEDAKELYDSNNDLDRKIFSTRSEAVSDCASIRYADYGFDVEATCSIYQPTAGSYACKLTGKKIYK